VLEADAEKIEAGDACVVITYGMGVYWAKEAAVGLPGQASIVDLRTLNPIDWELITATVQKHGRVLILTEEPTMNSFAESLAGRIARTCFSFLDAPVAIVGAVNLPAVPLNVNLEKCMLPNGEKVMAEIQKLMAY